MLSLINFLNILIFIKNKINQNFVFFEVAIQNLIL